MASRETLLKILDLARWAPSGDNTQPWRFEIVADDHIAPDRSGHSRVWRTRKARRRDAVRRHLI